MCIAGAVPLLRVCGHEVDEATCRPGLDDFIGQPTVCAKMSSGVTRCIARNRGLYHGVGYLESARKKLLSLREG